MKILVINGSPKGENSDTIKVTKAFLQGMGETAEIINTSMINVKPCLGCLACWQKSRGVCVQKDDMAAMLEKFKAADLIIWSTPLYFFSLPSSGTLVLSAFAVGKSFTGVTLIVTIAVSQSPLLSQIS